MLSCSNISTDLFYYYYMFKKMFYILLQLCHFDINNTKRYFIHSLVKKRTFNITIGSNLFIFRCTTRFFHRKVGKYYDEELSELLLLFLNCRTFTCSNVIYFLFYDISIIIKNIIREAKKLVKKKKDNIA